MIALVNMNLLHTSIPLPEWLTWRNLFRSIGRCFRSMCSHCCGGNQSVSSPRALYGTSGGGGSGGVGTGIGSGGGSSSTMHSREPSRVGNFQQLDAAAADPESAVHHPAVEMKTPAGAIASSGDLPSARPANASTPLTATPAPPHDNKLSAFGKTLEWNIQFAVLNSMFDERFLVRKGFYGSEGVSAMQRRFRWLGVLNLVLMPFIMYGLRPDTAQRPNKHTLLPTLH